MLYYVSRILGLGVVGGFFLLAYLAYRLVATMIAKEAVNPPIIKTFYAFLGFETLLSVVLLIIELRRGPPDANQRPAPRDQDSTVAGSGDTSFTSTRPVHDRPQPGRLTWW